MTETIRWGILGTGNIAHQFARGLQHVPDAQLIAVASRSQERAEKFGDEFNVTHRYPNYESLVENTDVDVVYISTPHVHHRDNTLLCLNAGKAVLCEKPFAINASEAAEMIQTARDQNTFLMEAMWMRFFPAFVQCDQMLKDGVIGEVRQFAADFGFQINFMPEHRLFNPDLGGGALLDVGIYPVSYASYVFGGPPATIASTAHLGETGVDEQSSYLFGYDGGQMALLSSAIRLNTPQDAMLMGTEGFIKWASPFWMPKEFTIYKPDGKDLQTYTIPYEGNGYNYEAIEVGNCLRAGKLESDVISLDETLQIMQTLDAIRAQWGLKYPMES